jgi:hypothetical protein
VYSYRHIDTTIEIAAPVRDVWSILTDFPNYVRWNPFLVAVSGEPRVGARLHVALQPPDGTVRTLRPRVLKVVPERQLCWRDRLFMPGLFTGEHRMVMLPSETGCRLYHGEHFSGVLAGPLAGSILESLYRGFDAMNHALKARAEGQRFEPEGEIDDAHLALALTAHPARTRIGAGC